ncbi:hypothetical protein HU200_064781 [Digitaria exilis]|uniref:Uncharacterized protein n=1 Tax=Digitaria exilis TaxID=1010633 RepID=A0A835A5D9_9POAL|nr:hypothetical protein HU200_064781 [Digitaria exilis]
MPSSSAVTMMGVRRSFAYHKLKKLPPTTTEPLPTTAATAAVFELQADDDDHHQQLPSPSAAAIEDTYRSYYRALGAAFDRERRPRRRLRRPRLRVSALARALRRRAAAVGGKVRASVAKVARRLREGRPYIADLFAGNYMFMQVAPSPTMALDGGGSSFAPFTEYYYAKHHGGARALPAVHRAAPSAPAAAGV